MPYGYPRKRNFYRCLSRCAISIAFLIAWISVTGLAAALLYFPFKWITHP